MEREAALHLKTIEETKASLIQTADALMRSPNDLAKARDALMRLKPQAVKALDALETIGQLRGLTNEERTYQRAFEKLLAVARNVG